MKEQLAELLPTDHRQPLKWHPTLALGGLFMSLASKQIRLLALLPFQLYHSSEHRQLGEPAELVVQHHLGKVSSPIVLLQYDLLGPCN